MTETETITPATPAPAKLKREIHWCTRSLYKMIMSRASTPFKWGENDCALFAADAILSMTGIDIASDFRGLYHDEASAMAAIENVTGVKGGTIEDAAAYCANKHQLTEWKQVMYAQRGDLVVYEDADRLVAGVIHLSGRHVIAPGDHGLKKILIHDGKTTPLKRAWHVPA
jgi:hypothetical protein